MSNMYILKDGVPSMEPDLMVWARWFESADRHVDHTEIGEVRVSTVFLGLDHGYGGVPALYETMIFGGPHNDYQERYATAEDAKIGHARAVALVRQTCDTPHQEEKL